MIKVLVRLVQAVDVAVAAFVVGHTLTRGAEKAAARWVAAEGFVRRVKAVRPLVTHQVVVQGERAVFT
jgi:hypothetical protein